MRRVWQRLARRKGTSLAALALAAVVGLALTAPVLPLPHPAQLRPAAASRPPAPAWHRADPAGLQRLRAEHPGASALRLFFFADHELAGALGTDALGRDVLSRVLWGGRVSLLVGLVAAAVSMLLGVGVGAVSGLAGGRLDRWLMRVVDGLYSVPLLFLVILVIALLREVSADLRAAGLDREMILYLVIGAVSWLTMARVVRGQVLALRGRDFVTAARALGARRSRVLLRHVLPNLWGIVIIYLTLTIPRVILFEAFLSFLGLGVEPPGVSWGILASEGLEQLTPVSVAWWLIVFPGLALVITLGALNTLGDALRDALDPRLTRAR